MFDHPLLKRAIGDLVIGNLCHWMNARGIERRISQLVRPQVRKRNVTVRSQSGELVSLDFPGQGDSVVIHALR